jgi:hypothetical protein
VFDDKLISGSHRFFAQGFNPRGEVMRSDLAVLGTAALAFFTSCPAFAAGPDTPAPVPTVPQISSKMTVVVGDLVKTKTGEPVQKQQKAILRDLDDLIAALERQCAACRNGIASNNPRRPAPDSNPHGGTGGIGDLVDPRMSEKDWAKLSSRERDRILQSMSEGFPPEYRTVLERYYRRLAEEKTIKAGEDRPQPKSAAETSKP